MEVIIPEYQAGNMRIRWGIHSGGWCDECRRSATSCDGRLVPKVACYAFVPSGAYCVRTQSGRCVHGGRRYIQEGKGMRRDIYEKREKRERGVTLDFLFASSLSI